MTNSSGLLLPDGSPAPSTRHTAAVVRTQFPIRPGCVLELDLPVDLTHVEADRFEQWITAYPTPGRSA